METQMAIDKLAQFCVQGHVAGPLFDWKSRTDLKFIKTFARYQPSDNSVRIINDHSYPKGRAFNEAIDENVKKELPIHVGQLKEFIEMVLECGQGSVMSKFDMTSAYKFVPVEKQQYRLQAIRICGAIFVDLKLSYGDASACHYYSYIHTLIQEALVFNAVDIPRDAVVICIDDSSAVAPKEARHWVAQYGERYKEVMRLIGAGTKEPDPLRFKCFELQTSGEILGVWINTENLTWSLSEAKLADILQKIDLLIEPENMDVIKVVTLKTFQNVLGKLGYLIML